MLFPNDLTDDSDTGVLFLTILSRKSRETPLSPMVQFLITVILFAICLYIGKRIADKRKLNEKKTENIVNCTPPPPYRGEPFPDIKESADNLNEWKPENTVTCTPPPPYQGEPFPKMKGNMANTSFIDRLKKPDATSLLIIATFLIGCFMPFASFEKGWYLKTVTGFTSLFYEESSLIGTILLTLPTIALFVNINMPRNTGVSVIAAFMAIYSFTVIAMLDHKTMTGLGGNIIYGIFSLAIVASIYVKKDFLKTLTLCALALSYFITWFYMDFSNIGSGQKLIKYSHNGEFWMFMFSFCPFIMIFFHS